MANSRSIAFYDANAAAQAKGWATLDRFKIHDAVMGDIESALNASRRERRQPEVLTIGEGAGQEAKQLFAEHFGARVTATDASAEMIKLAQAGMGHPDISYLQDAWPDLPGVSSLGKQFDLVFSNAALQELDAKDHARCLEKAIHLVRPGGKLILRYMATPTKPHHATVDTHGLEEQLTRMNDALPEFERLSFHFNRVDESWGTRKDAEGNPIQIVTLTVDVPREKTMFKDAPAAPPQR